MKPRLSLKGRGLQLLSQREQSRSELRRKLLAHLQAGWRAEARQASPLERPGVGELTESIEPAGLPDAPEPFDPAEASVQVEAVLDWLQAHQYLSEERFTESRVHARAGRYGNLRIRQELAQHGVSLSAAATQQLKDSELSRARQVWQRKFGDETADDATERARQMRFLAARGFSPEVIRRVVREGSAEA